MNTNTNTKYYEAKRTRREEKAEELQGISGMCTRGGCWDGSWGALRMRGKHDTSRTSPQPLSCLTETGSRITHKSLELAL